ncbi:MAG: hypothetical protein JEY97_06750 [Bacteroidales bacterium]|nr:hypothetical protein [Bacteroidales bacterium]
MKKTLLFTLISCLFMFTGFSQSLTLQTPEGVNIPNGGEITVYGEETAFEIICHVFITNICTSDINVSLHRNQIYLVGSSSSAFCWGICYSPSVNQSAFPIVIAAGATDEESFSGHYYPDGNVGISRVSYTFYDDVNPNDSIMVIVNYAAGIEGQAIAVEPGFQFVSSRINPTNPDLMAVANDIINDDLDYIRNSEGAMLRKIGPNWVNGIGNWVGTEGYLVKTNGNGQFSVEGSVIPVNTPINVESGFQFISYLPDFGMDAMLAFETIIGDNLQYIRDSEGSMIRKIGPNWVNGIGDCEPTQGYLVKMSGDDVLVYPDFDK